MQHDETRRRGRRGAREQGLAEGRHTQPDSALSDAHTMLGNAEILASLQGGDNQLANAMVERALLEALGICPPPLENQEMLENSGLSAQAGEEEEEEEREEADSETAERELDTGGEGEPADDPEEPPADERPADPAAEEVAQFAAGPNPGAPAAPAVPPKARAPKPRARRAAPARRARRRHSSLKSKIFREIRGKSPEEVEARIDATSASLVAGVQGLKDELAARADTMVGTLDGLVLGHKADIEAHVATLNPVDAPRTMELRRSRNNSASRRLHCMRMSIPTAIPDRWRNGYLGQSPEQIWQTEPQVSVSRNREP
jgi:hypothetical protein